MSNSTNDTDYIEKIDISVLWEYIEDSIYTWMSILAIQDWFCSDDEAEKLLSKI